MDYEVARNFFIALLIGALVGIDRERKKAAEPGHSSFGGIRTHILLALLGAAAAQLALQQAMPWVLIVALAIVGAAVVASYVRSAREHDDARGLTSEVAAIAVFVLAAMAVAGEAELAVALGVVTSATLAFKQPLHGAVARLDTQDVFAGLKLLIASFIVLPLLPDKTIDPWQAINPYKLWLLVILISALSLAGYVAVRWLGSTHGSAVTGLAGGLVSSTATTLSFARSSREAAAGDGHALTAGILLAWLVMFARVAVLIAVINRPLLAQAWLPIAVMSAVTAAFAFWHYRTGLASARAHAKPSPLAVNNPFSLTAATRFAALFAVVLLVVKLAERYAPQQGTYVVAALAGSVDVDAITLSMADSTRGTEAFAHATGAIVVAIVANSVVKCGAVLLLGAGRLRRSIVVATVAVLAAGFASLALR
jgi:uncharacterized membrane protein (DUF4010 family)